MGARPTRRALRPTAAKPLQTLGGLSREMRAVQDSIRQATKDARQEPFTRGRALRVVFVGSEAKTISHGLGRKPVGVVPRNQPAGETLVVGTTNLTSKLVTLTSNSSGTVEFWVY